MDIFIVDYHLWVIINYYWDDVDADINHYGLDALHSFDEAHGYVADEFNALVTDYNLSNEKYELNSPEH